MPHQHIISYHITSSLSLGLSLSTSGMWTRAHSLSLLHTHTTHTHTQHKQIESGKSWLFASDDLDDDGLRWCADLFVTARLMSHIINLCTSACVCICAQSLCISATLEVGVCVFGNVHLCAHRCVYDVCVCVCMPSLSGVCSVCDRHYLMQISQCTQIAGCVSKADRQMNLIC